MSRSHHQSVFSYILDVLKCGEFAAVNWERDPQTKGLLFAVTEVAVDVDWLKRELKETNATVHKLIDSVESLTKTMERLIALREDEIQCQQ